MGLFAIITIVTTISMYNKAQKGTNDDFSQKKFRVSSKKHTNGQASLSMKFVAFSVHNGNYGFIFHTLVKIQKNYS